MPPKKKQIKNAFFYFVNDLRDEEESRGNKMPQSFREMAEIAAPKWAELCEAEKQSYKELAKANKGQNANPLDCTGRSIAEVEREEQENEQREPRMLSFIENHLKELGGMDEIIAETFYVISFNIFCATVEKEYFAAEVGLVEYSIRDGIKRHFQRFIDPGAIRLGYASACRLISENSHQIPINGIDDDGEELDRESGSRVISEIIRFIDPDLTLDQYPPIYCKTQELEQTKYILDHLQIGSKRRVNFYVVDFSCLFLKLFQHASDKMISVGIVRDYLCSMTFTFNVNSCCDWHWKKDCAEYCALDVVKRSCFILSDHICEEYEIVPIANQHLPEKPRDNFVTYKPSSMISSRSSSAMSLSRSKASSQASVSLPPTPSSIQPKGLYSSMLNRQSASAQCKDEAEEPVALKPLRKPRMPSFAGSTTTPASSCENRGARPKSPSSTSSFSSVAGQFPPIGRGYGRGKRF